MLHLVVVNPCLMWLPSLSKNILVVIDTVDQVSADQSVKQYPGAKSPELPFFTSPWLDFVMGLKMLIHGTHG